MKYVLLAFLLAGCAASSGSGGHVVGNGMASDELATFQETKKSCKAGKKMGCGEDAKKNHSH